VRAAITETRWGGCWCDDDEEAAAARCRKEAKRGPSRKDMAAAHSSAERLSNHDLASSIFPLWLLLPAVLAEVAFAAAEVLPAAGGVDWLLRTFAGDAFSVSKLVDIMRRLVDCLKVG